MNMADSNSKAADNSSLATLTPPSGNTLDYILKLRDPI